MQTATCRHELLGERHPSYCKLAAVAKALHRGYSLVAFLDSDAFFRNLSLSVPQLLSLHRGSRLGGGTSAEPAAASFSPNGGVQFWRNTADAARLLRLWWHLPGGRYCPQLHCKLQPQPHAPTTSPSPSPSHEQVPPVARLRAAHAAVEPSAAARLPLLGRDTAVAGHVHRARRAWLAALPARGLARRPWPAGAPTNSETNTCAHAHPRTHIHARLWSGE